MPTPSQIIWSDEPGGNIEHLAEHGVTPEEAESVVVRCFDAREPSRSRPDRWLVRGFTPLGRMLVVVFEVVDLDIVVPVTAFEC